MNLVFWRKTLDVGPGKPEAVAVTEATPFPVQIIHPDENDIPPVQLAQGSVVDPVVARPTIYNKTLTSADTEYSQAMPTGCRRIEFQCRTAFDCRYAFEAGRVAASSAPYMTLKAGTAYDSGPISQAGSPSTIYLASATAGVIIEIITWV